MFSFIIYIDNGQQSLKKHQHICQDKLRQKLDTEFRTFKKYFEIFYRGKEFGNAKYIKYIKKLKNICILLYIYICIYH